MTAIAEQTEQAEKYERVFRRGAIWRLGHWANVGSILGCTFTGIYIADPFFGGHGFLMAWIRAIHLYFACVLDVSMIALAYLYFFSRVDRGIVELLPTRSNLRRFNEVLLNFVLLGRRKRFDSSRHDPFNAGLFLLLHVFVVIQMFTGLQMYVQNQYSGYSSIGGWWPWLLHRTTDWTLSVFGSAGGVRAAHLITMWFILAWLASHIYYEVWRTIIWREGDIGIAFGGYKFIRRRRGSQPDAAPAGTAETATTSKPGR